MVNSITPERARELSAGDYGEASVKYFSRYAVPLFYGRTEDTGRLIARNGTAFFLRTPEAVFGVTADHVIKECLEALREDNYSCGLFPVNYSAHPADLIELGDIEGRIIDRSERRDVATFRITEDEVKKLDVSVATRWPPVAPELEKGVGFCGFPSDGRAREIHRAGRREIVISFTVFPVLAVATSISEDQITYVFDVASTVNTQGFRIAPTDLDLGGMSGGPAFTKVETPSGIEHWAPAGVIYEGCMNPGLGEGRLFAARIDECLAATGRISG